jgi:hypothetical protein
LPEPGVLARDGDDRPADLRPNEGDALSAGFAQDVIVGVSVTRVRELAGKPVQVVRQARDLKSFSQRYFPCG